MGCGDLIRRQSRVAEPLLNESLDASEYDPLMRFQRNGGAHVQVMRQQFSKQIQRDACHPYRFRRLVLADVARDLSQRSRDESTDPGSARKWHAEQMSYCQRVQR